MSADVAATPTGRKGPLAWVSRRLSNLRGHSATSSPSSLNKTPRKASRDAEGEQPRVMTPTHGTYSDRASSISAPSTPITTPGTSLALNDNASIITLASSSKFRRRSLDTNASMKALAPSSIYDFNNGSHESLPRSHMSHQPSGTFSAKDSSSLRDLTGDAFEGDGGRKSPSIASSRLSSRFAREPARLASSNTLYDGMGIGEGTLGSTKAAS